MLECFERYNALQPRIPGEVMASIAALDDLEQLINLIGCMIGPRVKIESPGFCFSRARSSFPKARLTPMQKPAERAIVTICFIVFILFLFFSIIRVHLPMLYRIVFFF